MSTFKSILLKTDGTISQVSITNEINIDNIDYELIKNIFKKKGIDNIERQCDWELDDNVVFSLYGWSDGKSGTENKHELPPPVDEELLFGDLLVIKTQNRDIKHLSIAGYNEFYEMAFGGFEDLGSEDSDYSEDDEYDENDSFIVSDNDVLEEETESEEEEYEELEESEGESENLDNLLDSDSTESN